MPSAGRPWWQQATALVSLGAGGAVTGFSFVPRPAADLTSPSSMPVHLMALEQSARPGAADDGALRSAIVNVANYYRRMAESKTPAEMEAIIWQRDSLDGANHGASCAAFASLTLELGAHVTGGQSWVTGGSSYPWPLHDWVDARVNPNPDSPGITSIVQDGQAHDRWHALGDGYQPLPGDWVVFNGHVEVVTKDANGILSTIGGDSEPNFSVNAHEYPGPLAAQGVVGFVNNGALPALAGKVAPGSAAAAAGQPAKNQAKQQADGSRSQRASSSAPLAPAIVPAADVPGEAGGSLADTAVIPGLPILAHRLSARPTAPPAAPYRRHHPRPAPRPVHDTSSQQAFIGEVAPGAVAAQRKYGVPASVTIAQAIDESGWGTSTLATRDHNLFGIKGTGPAGSALLPTQEYQNGQLVTGTSSFRVYTNTAQSIDDHGQLLATSSYYRKSMAARRNPNAFAASLTGVYATDPSYGTTLISLMRRYDLYRYDVPSPASPPRPTIPATTKPTIPATTIPGLPVPAPSGPSGAGWPAPAAGGAPARGHQSGSGHPGPQPVASGSHQPARKPVLSRPTPAPASSSAPSAPAPSAGPSGGASAEPTRSAAPSGPAPSGRPSSAAAPTMAPSRPQPSGPAPSGPAPSGPLPPEPAPPGPASSTSAAPPPPAAPATAVPPAAPSSAAQSPAVPGMPVAATAHTGAAPSAHIPAGPATEAGPRRTAAPSAAAPAGQERPAAAPSGQRPASAPQAEAASAAAGPAALAVYAGRMAVPAKRRARRTASRHAYKPARRYHQQIPPSVRNAFVTTAKVPLIRAEPLYQDVASHTGISWELLAACDWMQCEARARYSPVHGEKLSALNRDGTSYHTKSEALEQCAEDLVELAETVYGIDLTAAGPLSIRDLANAFAAFRWGGLLRLHRTSAMEFPYSVAGLTPQHTRMRWPKIADPNTPDRPGSRFRKPFGAVPIVLSLNYPATV